MNEKTPISLLKNVISRLFQIQFDDFDFSKYHQDLPHALKEVYEVDAFMAKYNCSFETIRFFSNINRLVPYKELKLEEKSFGFLRENQNNWTCKAQLKSDEVFFEDHVEPQNSRTITATLDDFLTTSALSEMAFSMRYYFGLESENIDEIKMFFPKIEDIWLKKEFIYTFPCSFFLVDDDCFLMYAGMNIFATNNEEKFNHYKAILKHYDF